MTALPVQQPEATVAADSEGQAFVAVKTQRFSNGIFTLDQDQVIAETPVALIYNGISHAVMLTTPADLEDFALGFSLSEGVVECYQDIQDIDIRPGPRGIEIHVLVNHRCFAAFKATRRRLAGRTGCGLCGIESLEQALPPISKVGSQLHLAPAAIAHAMTEVMKLQAMQQSTGGVHAAAWAMRDGQVRLIREDVGRHNALDKLLGAMAGQRNLDRNGFAIITSRASHEMVHKAALAGIELLAAVSAPTSLAVKNAENAGLTLLGWLRQSNFTVYTRSDRITAR